jgi:type IV pilus assembly protein PilA
MFCSNCGAINEGGGQFCKKCGQPFTAGPPTGEGEGQISGKAVASLICGILFFIFPSAIAAVILGHISLSEIRKSAGRLTGEGMAITGLVLGYLGLLIIPIALIIGAIAVPNLLRARQAANEASAVGALRTINTANVTYAYTYNNSFAPNLGVLDGQEAGAASCDHADFIDGVLATGEKSGYTFRYVPLAADGTQLNFDNRAAVPAQGCAQAGVPHYKITADPMRRGQTGRRSFYTDDTGVIRWSTEGPATADSPPVD